MPGAAARRYRPPIDETREASLATPGRSSSPTRLPNPLRRLARNAPTLLVCLVLATLGVVANGLVRASTSRIVSEVNANWRGAYDILVTPAASDVTREAASTRGVIEPDFVAYSGSGGISLAKWAQVRRVAGVALAAPIGFVGYVTSPAVSPTVYIPPSAAPDRPAFFRLVITVTDTDGVHTRRVSRASQDVLLGGGALFSRSHRPLFRTAGQDWGAQTDDPDAGVRVFFTQDGPRSVSGVEAVDPAAEQALLGPSARVLAKLNVPQAERTIFTFPPRLVPESFARAISSLTKLFGEAKNLSEPASFGRFAAPPVIPVVAASRLPYAMTATLSVFQVGPNLARMPTDVADGSPDTFTTAEQRNGTALRLVGRNRLDLGTQTSFTAPAIQIPWPGSHVPARQGVAVGTHDTVQIGTALAQRSSYTATNDRGGPPSFTVTPTGRVNLAGAPRRTGLDQSYRTLTPYPLAIQPPKPGTGDADATTQLYALAPVAGFRFSDFRLPANPLNHVPLGAYEPTTGQLLGDGGQPTGTTVLPTADPVGFLTAPPSVIMSIQSAAILRGPHPIDAIRVRVAGIDHYDDATVQRVNQIAASIAALGGLHVQVVAGSSPQPVDVHVPDYYRDGTALGTVREEWTTLGAAQRTVTALTGGENVLLALIVGFGLVLVASAQAADVDAKRAGVRVLRSLGWRAGRQLWWLTSDALLGSALVVAASVLAAVLTRGEPWLALVGVGLGAALAAAAVALAALLIREPGRGRRMAHRGSTRRLRPVTTWRLAGTLVRRDGFLIGCSVLAAAATSLVLVLALGGITRARTAAGPTLLAGATSTSLRVYHAVLLVAVLAGSQLALVLLARTTLRRRRREFAALAAAGWSRRRIATELRHERLIGLALAAALAVAAWLALPATGAGVAAVLAVVAVVSGGALLAGEAATRRQLRGF